MDNLKTLKVTNETVYTNTGGPGSILAVDIQNFNKDVLEKMGRYTGLPFVSRRAPTGGIILAGNLYWNTNAMNRTTPFVITFSNTTLDANRLSRILSLMVAGDIIKFKDFAGRTTTLEFQGFTQGVDGSANPYCEVTVKGFAENTSYAYQVADVEPCMVEFFTSSSSGTLDQVLTLGNDSERDAKVGSLGIYDPAAGSWMMIKGDDKIIEFYDADDELMFRVDYGSGTMKISSNISGFGLAMEGASDFTANRTATFPNKSGTVAFLDDLVSGGFRAMKTSTDNPYMLLTGDHDKHLWLNAVTTINIPTGIAINEEFVITSAGGVTLNLVFADPDVADPAGTQTVEEFQTVTIKKIFSDAWLIIR